MNDKHISSLRYVYWRYVVQQVSFCLSSHNGVFSVSDRICRHRSSKGRSTQRRVWIHLKGYVFSIVEYGIPVWRQNWIVSLVCCKCKYVELACVWIIKELCLVIERVAKAWWRYQWKHFPRYWSFVRGIHWSPVNSPHIGRWRGAWLFSLICAWTYGWDAGDLKRHRTHYDGNEASLWSYMFEYGSFSTGFN